MLTYAASWRDSSSGVASPSWQADVFSHNLKKKKMKLLLGTVFALSLLTAGFHLDKFVVQKAIFSS